MMQKSGKTAPCGATGKEAKMTNAQAKELVKQIGKMNMWAISGGRAEMNAGALILRVGQGYRVRVILEGNDTYTVQRMWRNVVKGEASNVYADEIGEVAYVASCYVNRAFGAEVAA
jgi:hypothetical protein